MKICMSADHWGTLDGETYFQMTNGAVYDTTPEAGFALVDAGVAIDAPHGDDWQPTPRPVPAAVVESALAAVAAAIVAPRPAPTTQAPSVTAIVQSAQSSAPVSALDQAAQP